MLQPNHARRTGPGVRYQRASAPRVSRSPWTKTRSSALTRVPSDAPPVRMRDADAGAALLTADRPGAGSGALVEQGGAIVLFGLGRGGRVAGAADRCPGP